MGTKYKRPGGSVELETDEVLASEKTLHEIRKKLLGGMENYTS